MNGYTADANNFNDNNEIFHGILQNDNGRNVDIIRDNIDLQNLADIIYRKINLCCIAQKHIDNTLSFNLYTGTEEDLGLSIPFDQDVDEMVENLPIGDILFYNMYSRGSFLLFTKDGKIDLKAQYVSVLKTIKDGLQKQYDINAKQITVNTSIIAFNTTLITVISGVSGINASQILQLTNNNATINTNNTSLQLKNTELKAIIDILTSLIV